MRSVAKRRRNGVAGYLAAVVDIGQILLRDSDLGGKLRVGLFSLDLFHQLQKFLDGQCLVRHTGVQYAELAYLSSGSAIPSAMVLGDHSRSRLFLFALSSTGQV